MSAFADAAAPLKARYAALSPRERLLVAGAAALLGVLALMLLVVNPIRAARADGIADYRDAVETRAAVARAVGAPSQASATDGTPLRTVLEQTADASGVVIGRYDFEEGEAAVDLSVQDLAAPVLYAWLSALEDRHGVVVRQATVRSTGEEGLVTARLTLERR